MARKKRQEEPVEELPQVEIEPSGDRELWLVNGEDWTIPVFVDPYESKQEPKRKLYLISPAVSLLKPQLDVLLGALRIHIIGEAHATAWWANQDVFHGVATKAPGITPKYYYKWKGAVVNPTPSIPQQAPVEEEIDDDADAFLKFIAGSTAIFNINQLRLFWRAFYQYGMEWMVNQQRPINLGFAVIHPLPYRRNWKEIMHAKHPRSAASFFQGKEAMEKEIRLSGFEEDLYHTELVALDQSDHFVYWSLEVVPLKPWTHAIQSAEKIRRSVKGSTQYARYYIRQVKNRLPAILAAYKSWLTEVRRPCGDVVEDGVTSAQRIVPFIPRGHVVPRASAPDVTTVVVSTEERLRGTGVRQALEEEAASMWKMPKLLLGPEDVREPGKALDEPSDGAI